MIRTLHIINFLNGLSTWQFFYRLLEKFEACEKDPTYLAYLQSVASAQSRPAQPVTSAPSPFTSAISWKSTANSTSVPVGGGVTSRRGQDQRLGYVRLTRSLLSGFPNEVDFAFNVLTVMAFKSPAGFTLTEVGLWTLDLFHG
jgi:hypothetical protein